MTTDSLEHHGPTRSSAAARLGSIAGVTPVVMFVAWCVIAPWSGPARDLLVLLGAVVGISVATGWIVGARSGRSIGSILLDVIAFPTVAWLIFLPIAAIWSTWPWGLAYGLVSSLYVIPLLTPFGAGWALTYLALRRGMGT